MLDKAYATGDAVLTRMYGDRQQHPIWRKDAYLGDVVVRLTPNECVVAKELIERSVGDISLAFRSFLAQLGIDAGHEETTSVQLKGQLLHMNTMFVNVNGERGERVLKTLRSMMDRQRNAIVGRALLAPQEAHCSAGTVEYAKETKACDFDERAILREDGGVALPPTPVTYAFADGAYKPSTLEQVLEGRGSGRAMLAAHRTNTEGIPHQLEPGGFFVGGFDISMPGLYHAVLRRKTVNAEGEELSVQHSGAVLLAAGRTDTSFGSRQTELVVTGEAPVQTADIHVIADVYRASEREAGAI